ncbi:hypothetical protein Ciccas_000235 [Cichlidogyrus casuarinus]|uniref:Smr domain-containing protein n=1 Tax=Cichlidogyrus casuarinus TaxID=1844966 RepID=A0ABD2QNU6_9PLAT
MEEKTMQNSLRDHRHLLAMPEHANNIKRLRHLCMGRSQSAVEDEYIRCDFDFEKTLSFLQPRHERHNGGVTNQLPYPAENQSLADTINMDQAIKNSIQDQKSNLSTYGSKMALEKLQEQFPSITKDYLESLYVQSGFDQTKVVDLLKQECIQPVSVIRMDVQEGRSMQVTPNKSMDQEWKKIMSTSSPARLGASEDEITRLHNEKMAMSKSLKEVLTKGATGQNLGGYIFEEKTKLMKELEEVELELGWLLTVKRSAAAKRSWDYLDLHQLSKNAALILFRARYNHLANEMRPAKTMTVVTGRGLHSRGEPVVKAALIDALIKNKMYFELDEANEGQLFVSIKRYTSFEIDI